MYVSTPHKPHTSVTSKVYGGETFTTDKLLLGVQTLSKTWIQPRGLGSVNTKVGHDDESS